MSLTAYGDATCSFVWLGVCPSVEVVSEVLADGAVLARNERLGADATGWRYRESVSCVSPGLVDRWPAFCLTGRVALGLCVVFE